MNLTTHDCTRNVLLVEGDPTCGGGGGGLTNSWWWGEFKLEHAGTCSLMMGELINRCGGGSSRSVFRNHCYIWEVDD